MPNFTIQIEDHSGDVLRELEDRIYDVLDEWGRRGDLHVQDIITREGRIDTGAMRNSITYQVDMGEQAVYVGTNDAKAVYHEYGTGIFLESEDGRQGRQTPWVYKDSRGDWHRTRGMKPIYMIKNGIGNNVNEFKRIAEDMLKG